MKKNASRKSQVYEQKVILGLSLPMVALLIASSTVGLLYPGIYKQSTPNWLAQTVAQDGVNLFLIVPVLLVAALYSFQGVKLAFLMWGGTVGYLLYTFLIYCFSVHFNVLFPIYCLVLGLTAFSLFWFITTQVRTPVITKLESKPIRRLTGIYFILISTAFYALWLFEVIPAILAQETPKTLSDSGLMTNPVHVIDLSVFLPLVFITGVMAIRARPFIAILIPAILVFFVLMGTTVAVLTIVLFQNGLGGSPWVAMAMGVMVLFNVILLVLFVGATKDELSN